MGLNDDIRILSGAGLLAGLSQDHLRLLAFGAETVRLGEGRELYREGERADCAYVVVSGELVLSVTRDGEKQEMGRVAAGAMLGELALISDMTRLTDAEAVGEASVLRINRVLFRRILEEYPDVAQQLHRRIAADLQALVARLEKLLPRFS